MRIFLKGKSAHIICKLILTHGPMTMDRGVALHGVFGENRGKTRQAYERAVKAGWLNVSDGLYALTDEAAEYVRTMPEPEQLEPRTTYIGQVATLRARVPDTFRTAVPTYRVTRAECEPLNPRCNGRSDIAEETLIRGVSI